MRIVSLGSFGNFEGRYWEAHQLVEVNRPVSGKKLPPERWPTVFEGAARSLDEARALFVEWARRQGFRGGPSLWNTLGDVHIG